MKRLILLRTVSLALFLLATSLSACSSENDDGPGPESGLAPTPDTIPWQRPETAISQDTPLVRLTGLLRLHQQTVNDVAFSANGTRLASVGADNNIVVWNLANGQSLFVQSNSDARRVFFGPDDETLISVNRDGMARVWAMDLSPPRALEEMINFAGHDGIAGIVAQSPDRSLLAFGARSGGIRVWRVPDGQLVADLEGHTDSVQHLVFSPDGQQLASIGTDQGIRVWSMPGGELVHDLVDVGAGEAERTPQRATFSPAADRLAVANTSGIELWDMTTGESRYFIETAENNAAGALVFSTDGTLLVGCGLQPLIGIWQAATGGWVAGLPIPGEFCANAQFSPDGTLLLTLPSPGRQLYLWNLVDLVNGAPPNENLQLDVARRENMGLFAGPLFWNTAWSEDGRFIVVLDELGPIYVLTAAPS